MITIGGKLGTPRLSSFKCKLEFSWGKIWIYINTACYAGSLLNAGVLRSVGVY